MTCSATINRTTDELRPAESSGVPRRRPARTNARRKAIAESTGR